MNHSDPLIKGIRQTLDNQPVSTETQRKLARARQRALDPDASRPRLLSSMARPALAVASLCVLVIAITLSMSPEEESGNLDFFESMDIITSRDDLEMYENLEFYLWLDEQLRT